MANSFNLTKHHKFFNNSNNSNTYGTVIQIEQSRVLNKKYSQL